MSNLSRTNRSAKARIIFSTSILLSVVLYSTKICWGLMCRIALLIPWVCCHMVLSLGWWMADKCSKCSSLFQSKFCITSSRSTSGCRSGDTLTASTNMWTVALPWICRTFIVDRPSQVTSPGCLWKETLLNGYQLFFFFVLPAGATYLHSLHWLERTKRLWKPTVELP